MDELRKRARKVTPAYAKNQFGLAGTLLKLGGQGRQSPPMLRASADEAAMDCGNVEEIVDRFYVPRETILNELEFR